MSRSYKHTPYNGDKKGKRKKRIASKYIRNYLKQHIDIDMQNNEYKKYYCTWNICDFFWILTLEEWLHNHTGHADISEADIQRYHKYYIRK